MGRFEEFIKAGRDAQQAVDQIIAARALVGKAVYFAHQPDGPVHGVVFATSDGMVTLDDLPGEFAPHLFVKVKR